MKKPLLIAVRLKLFLWFSLAAFLSLINPNFGYKVLKIYYDNRDDYKSNKINDLYK